LRRENYLTVALEKNCPRNFQTGNHTRLLRHNLHRGAGIGRDDAVCGCITGTDIFGKRTTNAVEDFEGEIGLGGRDRRPACF